MKRPDNGTVDKVCGRCFKPVSSRSSGLCKACYNDVRRQPERACSSCASPIGKRTKTGLCNSCFNRSRATDPEFQARRLAGIRRKFEDPAHYEKMCRVARRNGEKARCDPEFAKKLSERGKILAATVLRTPEARAKLATVRAENGRKQSETRLAWCPPDHRDRYRFLTKSKRMLAADARAKVLEEVERDRLAKTAATGLSSAIDYLRRYAPISPRGDGFLYGTALLSAEELIARAEAKGWQPERWAA